METLYFRISIYLKLQRLVSFIPVSSFHYLCLISVVSMGKYSGILGMNIEDVV